MKTFTQFAISLFMLVFIGACATMETTTMESKPAMPGVYRSEDFVVVKAKEGDSFRNLARTYLGDEKNYWVIQDFNKVSRLEPGREVIIPLKYDRRGGLYPDGYQLVPILVYHRFETHSNNPLSITTEIFESQMRFLYENGYRAISLADFYKFSKLEKTIPKKAVIITIDDGYRSVYDVAYPLLRKFGFTATLFIYTDFIDQGRRALTWEQLKEMHQAGFDVQAHTKSHADLTVQKPQETREEYLARIDQELMIPKELIKDHLGYDPIFLAYPYGRTNETVVKRAKELGYVAGFTVRANANPFFAKPYIFSRAQIYNSKKLAQFLGRVQTFREQDLR